MKVKKREPNNRCAVVHSKRSDLPVVQFNQGTNMRHFQKVKRPV